LRRGGVRPHLRAERAEQRGTPHTEPVRPTVKPHPERGAAVPVERAASPRRCGFPFTPIAPERAAPPLSSIDSARLMSKPSPAATRPRVCGRNGRRGTRRPHAAAATADGGSSMPHWRRRAPMLHRAPAGCEHPAPGAGGAARDIDNFITRGDQLFSGKSPAKERSQYSAFRSGKSQISLMGEMKLYGNSQRFVVESPTENPLFIARFTR
jgi:hypothetical protein